MKISRMFNRTWFVIIITASVVIPRSLLIASSHSESCDDRFHIRHGLAFLTGTIRSKDLVFSDPPLGEAIIALPVYLVNLYTGYPLSEYGGDGEPISLEAFALIFAAWKSLIFSLGIGLAFHWCREVYGLRSAWLATILLTFEPNLAAHIPIPALDVLGMEAILLACYVAWKFVTNPTWLRAAGLGAATAMAMLTKHTAAILPLVIFLMAALQWFIWPRLAHRQTSKIPDMVPFRKVRMLALAGVLGLFFLWFFLLFDRTPPIFYAMNDAARASSRRPELRQLLELRWPAGLYVSCLIIASARARGGHPAFLLGQKSANGWWYYLPLVALYKVPIGILLLMVLAVLSLYRTRPRWNEWGLALPVITWGLYLMASRFSIGIRHFFPCYVFLIMLASRCVSSGGGTWLIACYGAAIAVVSHSLYHHPNYISYTNYPREKIYLKISDSNLDWGQSLKQIRAWLDSNPPGSRPVTLGYFGGPQEEPEGHQLIGYYLERRVTLLGKDDPLPTHGLLIVSPIMIAGPYEENDRLAPLQQRKPDDVIGNCMLVFDMDKFSLP